MKALHTILNKFTWVLVFILGILLFYSTFELIILLGRSIYNRTAVYDFNQVTVVHENLFLMTVQGFLAGVLLLTIIIELMHTLLATLDHDKKANIVTILLEIGLIAVIRHLFIMELDHVKGINVIGIAILILVLGGLMLGFNRSPLLSMLSRKFDESEKEEDQQEISKS